MTFTLIVERDDTTGLLRGTLADTPQRAFQARTIAELKARANEVLSAEQGGTDGARSERSYMIAIRWKCPSGTHATVEHLSLIHISEPTRLGMISYAVFCLKKKTDWNG